jgi:hypothetical protein
VWTLSAEPSTSTERRRSCSDGEEPLKHARSVFARTWEEEKGCNRVWLMLMIRSQGIRYGVNGVL